MKLLDITEELDEDLRNVLAKTHYSIDILFLVQLIREIRKDAEAKEK
jgi:hypothetical protein